MAGIDKRLTDLTELTTPSDNAFIHIVEPSDISQNPAGSSFKVRKSNFGGLSDAPIDGVTYGRKDGDWEVINSEVLTTNTNITSSVLVTQTVAGFVSYINALVSSFAVAANEIRTYTVTDTGQKFEILLRGRSFGGSEPDITTSDVLELEHAKDFLSVTGRVTHTGTASYTRLATITIPANFIPENSVWEIQLKGSRGAVGVASSANMHATFSGTTEPNDFMRNIQIGTGTFFCVHASRRIIFRGGNRESFNNSGFPHDLQSAQNNADNVPFDRTVSNDLYVGITLGSGTDTAYLDYVTLRRIG